jgi:hypothetical protein
MRGQLRFNPSPYSYGCGYGDAGQVTIPPIDQPAAAAPTAGAEKKPLIDQITPFLGFGISAGKSILGMDSDGRESVAVLEAKLTNYRQAAASAPSLKIGGLALPPGKEYYENLARKTEGLLLAARAQAEEEEAAQQLAQFRDVGYVLAVGAGVLLIGGFAVVQIQKSRKTQAEIEQLRASR